MWWLDQGQGHDSQGHSRRRHNRRRQHVDANWVESSRVGRCVHGLTRLMHGTLPNATDARCWWQWVLTFVYNTWPSLSQTQTTTTIQFRRLSLSAVIQNWLQKIQTMLSVARFLCDSWDSCRFRAVVSLLANTLYLTSTSIHYYNSKVY